MKSKFLHYAFVAMCAVFAFTACSEDDDNGNSIAQKVVGEYTGELNVMGISSTQDIILSKAGDSRVKIVLKDFSFGDMNIGDISAVCDVIEEDGRYLLSGTTNVKIMQGMITVPVSVSGDVYGRELELDLDINLESIGQGSITASFSGERPNDIDNSEESDSTSNELNQGVQAISPHRLIGEWKVTHWDSYKVPGSYIMTMTIKEDGSFSSYDFIPGEDGEEDEERTMEGTWRVEGNDFFIVVNNVDYGTFRIKNLHEDEMKTFVPDDEEIVYFTWKRQ